MARAFRFLFVALMLTPAACASSGDESRGSKVPSALAVPTTLAAPTTSAAPTGPAKPEASPYVKGFGDLSRVSLPVGSPGAVTIIASGTKLDRTGSVPMVVRNNTAGVIGGIDVSGTAREAGKLGGSGSSQGFQPKVVAPGEIAYGYVYFDSALAGKAFEFSFDVDSRRADKSFLPATVSEVNKTGEKIIGAVTNDTGGEMSGPISVSVICFLSDNSVSVHASAYVKPDDLPAGGTGSFALDLRDGCPTGLVAASGYGH